MKIMQKPHLLNSIIISFILLIFCEMGFAQGEATVQKDTNPPKNIIAKKQLLDLTCLDCHQSVKGINTRAANYHGDCETCHTGAEEHRDELLKGQSGNGSIAFPQVKECMNCHKVDKILANWEFSEHSKGQAICTECHTLHAAPVPGKSHLAGNKIDNKSANCSKCHQDVASRFNMSSHHPVNEGAMSCASCHDPHGSPRITLKGKNDQCLGCHQAIRGPMVFEHAPVVEDCMSCHDPHGASSRRLLSVSQPMVCLQCHSIVQGKHGYGSSEPSAVGTRTISGAVLRNCTNCHSAIHGSHQDPVLRY